jgi:ABC-type lipoprotein export system ATPase subunit
MVEADPESSPIIELRDVAKVYKTPAGEFSALRNVNLKVYPGEFVAVLGKSGAGKSTMLNLITGIDRPSSGEIIIGGTAIHTLKEDQLARWRGVNMGVVFQFFQLLPNLNLVENITLTMDFCGTYPLRERRQRALDLLEMVGIREHAYKTPSKISGGQQQRVAIARALANHPPLMVADEPTGNLDERTANEIFDLFESLVDHGHTLLTVTHDPEIAARANRIIEIADGEVVAGA